MKLTVGMPTRPPADLFANLSRIQSCSVHRVFHQPVRVHIEQIGAILYLADPKMATRDDREAGGVSPVRFPRLHRYEPVSHPGWDVSSPASFSQRRLWFLAQLNGAREAYHISIRLRLRGELDCSALSRAYRELLARHDILRVVFLSIDGEVYQRVQLPDGRFSLEVHEVSGDGDAALAHSVDEEAAIPFDLEVGPLIRGRLIKIKKNDFALLITLHHIVSDGWSSEILLRELGCLYRYYRGEGPPLEPLKIQYSDYARWQRTFLSDAVVTEQRRYWRSMLQDAPDRIRLPLDKDRPREQDYAGAQVPILIDLRLARQLRELSRRHGTTLFMTMLVGWAIVLSRLANQDDIIIGVPSANRGRLEIQGLIGCFINTLALRIDLSGVPTVGELLRRVKTVVLGAQAHQELPFENVVALLRPTRSLGHTPIFQLLFGWQNTANAKLEISGIHIERMENRTSAAQSDLMLELEEVSGAISGNLIYASALFNNSTPKRWASFYGSALVQMVSDDRQIVRSIPLLSPYFPT